MTAQALANRCAELGHPLDRSVIAKLEKGFRQTVTVADLLVLARALEVPPVTLLFPLDEAEVEVLPGELRPMWSAVQWFAAERPFPAREEDPAASSRWEPPAAIALYRQHEEFVRECLRLAGRAADYRTQATLAAGDAKARLETSADADATLAMSLREVIQGMRRSLRSLNHEPPPLPEPLRGLDEETN